MIIRWTPEPGDPVQEFSFKPEALLSPEAEPIEAAGAGLWDTYDGWRHLFRNGHKRAERVALWTCLRRTDPALQLSDVVVRMDSMTVVYDIDDKRTLRQAFRDRRFNDEWTPEDLEATLASPWLQLPEGEEDPPPLPLPAEQSGSTPTPSAEHDTGGQSPTT